MTDTNKNPDPKRKPAEDPTSPPREIPIVRRTDVIDQRLPARVSLTENLELGMNEKVLGWFQALSPSGTAAAIHYSQTATHTLLRVAKAGDPEAEPLVYGKTGRTAWCKAWRGFNPAEFPLLQEGTVYFNVEHLQLPDGTPCLGVIYKTVRLARTEPKLPLRRRKNRKQRGTLGATIRQIQAATAAAQAEAVRALARAQAAKALSEAHLEQAQALAEGQAKALAEAAAANQAAANQAAMIQAAANQITPSQAAASTLPEGEKPDSQA